MDPLKYIVPGRKRLPYGMMNFAVIRREDYYYVDKTRFIPMIEEADRFFFFIRPRRFGKSLTLNVLQHYYDVRTRDRFEDLFGDLYIGQHPTPSRNTYLVLYLNFSGITGELSNYRKGLDAHCGITFENFCKKYADLLPQGTPEGLCAVSGAVEQLDYLYQACERAGQKMYLFIDEYDHFTNAILADPESLHRYTNETHGEGYLRAFFNKVKAGTYSSIERCFITGVSPVTMDDLTSGFNIGTNYSLTPEFNQLMGFTEEEVREMLTYYSTTSPFHHTVDELIEIMKPWYDNYCFAQKSYGGTTMYNSNMVLYFVKNYILYGNAPDNMVEENIRIDYEKLRMLIRKDKEFAHDASVIQTLVSQGFITGELKTGFPASGITNPDNFVSLLYYFGMLTISGTHEGKTKLTIPNLVVQEQLYTYLLNTYNDADLSFSSYEKSELASRLAYRGDWQAYFDYIADCLKTYASQRDKQKGEFFVHGFTLAMTAQNRFYRPVSEQDTQAGYVDIFLCPMLDIYSDMTHSYIVELKYAKYKDPETRVEELRQEAIAQANRYADTDTVKRAIGSTRLHKIVVVYKGMEMRVCEEIS
ncbi:AAA family ATPase [Bacteroides cellulosilyticus]|uniref:AAA family ATPase n=1 Tax=Bacteroides cellulosilyticus TaxID=246787 RepID=UPI001C37E2BC|nr:AAA family ATPase [Bacteroides cellulosilyticus]MBV3639435.1 ATP-binding protein [Bacteroides cellulosilyticus]MBV3665465.1 ATP-binding protein [Bacteroides cellulosilyticus]MBV3687533.1 ATP-binding protein [Bacteroides cellulosilyticus]MBV3696234.1 ATP-binding protein [Bacteroides cellulosilyticus]MBV3709800.1 ATP-binding protein [Bacteroides cellulosilyticus]